MPCTHNTAPTQSVEANGIRYAYRRFGAGDGLPLVCLQHFRGGLDNWDRLVTDGLAENRSVILFNNAGIATSSIREDFWENPVRFWTIDDDDYRRFLEINTLSAVRLASLVAPEMIARSWGRIVNVTTSLSTMLLAGQAAYSVSKAGLEAVTSVMAGDLAGTGVTANVLAPGGPADTRMVVGLNVPREALIPADCMAAPAVWLASNASDGVTGRRFLGIKWDPALPRAEAAIRAGAPVAWTGYGDQMRPPAGGMPPQKPS